MSATHIAHSDHANRVAVLAVAFLIVSVCPLRMVLTDLDPLRRYPTEDANRSTRKPSDKKRLEPSPPIIAFCHKYTYYLP
jgi:hypothetical protein